MTPSSLSDEKIQKIIRTYSLVHTLFFGLGLVLCIVFAAVAIGYMLFIHADSQSVLVRNDDSLIHEQKILSSMKASMDEYATYEGMQLFIKQWHLSLTGEAIVSIDNLITYKWLVVPRLGSISLASILPSIDMLTGASYVPDDLNNYIQNMIMSYPAITTLSDNAITFLPFGSSLIDYFGISCITTPKVTDRFCQQALTNMVNVLPAYDLAHDGAWLESIALALSQTDNHRSLCDGIEQYVFFSHDVSESVKAVMYQCGSEYENSYNNFISFRNVQEQLDKQSINATISPDLLINAYKLISTQQNIYYEMTNKRVNDVRIRSYLKYTEELLRRPESIQSIYFDVIAWFNNQYLIPSLTRLYFQQKWQENSDTRTLLDSIRMINDGSTLLWYPWLSQLVADKTLIAPRTQTVIDTWSSLKPVSDIFRDSYLFPRFVVTQSSSWKNDSLTVDGSWIFDKGVWLSGKLLSSLSLTYDGVRFAITHATFSWYPRIETTVNTLLASQTMTIPELYDVLVRDGARFNLPQLWLCDTVRTFSGYVSCSPQKIVFQWRPLTGAKTIVTYTINHTNGLLISYTIDNAAIEAWIRDQLWTPQTTVVTMVSFIQSMLRYRITTSSATPSWAWLSWAADLIQVRQDMLDLGAKVTSLVASWAWLYSASIVIKDIPCVIMYDVQKQSILSLSVTKDGKNYPIRGFTLSLITMESPFVKAFMTDPRSVMMQFDPLIIKKLGI